MAGHSAIEIMHETGVTVPADELQHVIAIRGDGTNTGKMEEQSP